MRTDRHDEASKRFQQFCGPILKTKGGRMLIVIEELIDILIYLVTSIGLTAGGSSIVHIYTQTIHRATQ
jgi:hypothetical protein